MKRFIAICLMIIGPYTAAHAGPFTDEMTRCLVTQTSQEDRTLLIKWIYAAMSSHPDVKQMSNVTPDLGNELNKQTADLIVDLLTERCKKQAQDAMQFEGQSSFSTSFEVLGQVAMQGLMTNPEVGQYLSGLDNHFDAEKLKQSLQPPQ